MFRLRNVEVELSPGFLSLVALMVWMDKETGFLPWALTACVAHEVGHLAAGALLRGKLERFSLTFVGAEMSVKYARMLSYREETAVALAGPAMNLLFGAAAGWLGATIPAVFSLVVGGFNLLPVLPLDGGRVLQAALNASVGVQYSERLMTVSSGLVIGVMLGLGMLAAEMFANFTLLLTSGWLLVNTLKENWKNEIKSKENTCN